ncbi:FAD-binding protein [Streptomyces sp. NPDC029554]|uniref:FAD-binding oxidoreductase n=1 Tax=Streptomyces sp. NPDC029554 TaxID=3155126 RepID=UPI0033E6DBEB
MRAFILDRFIDRLRATVRGDVVAFGGPGYSAPVTGSDLTVESRPAVVVIPMDAADVATVVRAAVEEDVPIAAFSGGHGFHQGVQGAVINLCSLRSLDIDSEAKVARLGAGITWAEVAAAAEPIRLEPQSRSGADVIGCLLGGVGPIEWVFGYGSDSVVQFEVVTNRGDLVVSNAGTNPDLFRALRSGRFDLGIVVSVTVRLTQAVANKTLNGHGVRLRRRRPARRLQQVCAAVIRRAF